MPTNLQDIHCALPSSPSTEMPLLLLLRVGAHLLAEGEV